MSLPAHIEMALAELEQSMEQKLPEFKSKLQYVHTLLKADPNNVTIMSEEQIGLVVKGLITMSGEALIAEATKPSRKKAAAVQDLGLF